MKSLLKFLALPFARKALFCEAFVCVALLRLALTFIPFRWVFAWSKRWEQSTQRHASPDVDEVETALAKVVQSVSRRIPAASCLTQALTLQMLLARRGQHSKLHIGVCKEAQGDFRAHAWLETRHGVVIGGGQHLRSYVPILSRPGLK